MKLPRRQFLHLAAGAAASVVPQIATAQTYPTRAITLVVPVAAGGGVDTAARILAGKLQEKLKQPVIVEDRPGAGSMIGANLVAKATPDGHTLLLMEPGAVLAKWLNKSVPYDVTKDFTPIALVANSTACTVCASLASRERRQGIDRLCQGQSPQARGRNCRTWVSPSPCGGMVEHGGEDRDHGCALSWRGTRAQ